MKENFESRLARYAELLVVHGLNVQPGQIVNIGAEVCHRELAYLLAAHAYERGAKLVITDLSEPRLAKKRLEHASESDLQFVPKFVAVKYDEILENTGANIRIVGPEDPDLLSELDPKRVNTMQLAQRKVLRSFYEEGIGKSKVHWTVAAGSTPKWGQKVFPGKSPEEACDALWDAIFKASRADDKNCLENWLTHNAMLQQRAKMLTELQIRELHFTGPGTDLIVGLSDRAIFKGGRDLSPRNVEFEPNIPTEEVFTTPDYRATRGTARATRPFFINGKLIRGLELRFEKGEIVEFHADEGHETFATYIASDVGAKRLGEVALVGIDSPIFQLGHVFQEILFDENAACHIAVGMAYRFCVRGGATMTPEELEACGCNESHVHTDMMISNESVSVAARLHGGKEVGVIENGKWVIERFVSGGAG